MTSLRLSAFENKCDRDKLVQRKKKFKSSDYAAERDVELETAIPETFGSVGRREAMEQVKNYFRTQRKSLLHVLIENRLTFMIYLYVTFTRWSAN